MEINHKSEKDINSVSGEERSTVIGVGLAGLGPGGNASVVESKDGKIVRIRPLHYDWKYDKNQFNPWTIEAGGKTFEPKMKALPPAFGVGYKKRVYSPNRILYPLKRVDWNPNGDRNPQNRGTSGYVRISWDEATDIIANEIKRMHKTYGGSAILSQCDGHGETKAIHKAHGCNEELLKLMGDYTLQTRNADSWEGWYWGARHAWGMEKRSAGQMMPVTNLVPDVAKHCSMVLFWGCDPETTPGAQNGQTPSRVCYWWTELGIYSVYICPDLNYGAAVHADKWIPVRPGTDAALQLAVVYIWITENTFDKEYIATHTVGYEKFADYVLGKEDGIPKTPAWASPKCTVPEWTIKALAREWAKRVTTIAHGNGGPGIRSAYSSENARLEVLLLAMRGLGKPGVHSFKMLEWPGVSRENAMPGSSISASFRLNRFAKAPPKGSPGIVPDKSGGMDAFLLSLTAAPKYFIPKDLIHDALLNAPISWYGTTSSIMPTSDQFVKYKYPADGGSEIHMIWTDTPCWITCWNDSNSYIKALRSSKIEFILAQHPWLENDCQFADIILPITTKFEVNDLDMDSGSGQWEVALYQQQCVAPVGESKSDYEAVCLIAEKLGLLDEYRGGGKTVEELEKLTFENSEVSSLITFEELKEKGYFVVPTDPDWDKQSSGLQRFYEDPDNNVLQTPSGLIEFYSEKLAKYFPDDQERPPTPHWIEKGESHDERVSSARAKKYPLLQVSNHPRWRMHANCDDITWTRECPTGKVKGFDGYLYEPLWMNPVDADARDIRDGDIVKIFNERGTVLGGAFVSERIMPGAVSMDHGARYDAIIPGELDRGGAINTITPHKVQSKNATGMVCSSFLVEVEKVTREQMQEWRKQYPAAFERAYDSGAGLCFEAKIVRQ